MIQLTKWATGGVVLAVVIVLSGCSSAGSGSTLGNEARNSTNNASIQKSNSGYNNNSAMGNATSVGENASASNAASPTVSVPPSVTLENIQYSHDSLLLSLTHGNMQETYSNPHFTSGTTKQFVITLRNTSAGKDNAIHFVVFPWFNDDDGLTQVVFASHTVPSFPHVQYT